VCSGSGVLQLPRHSWQSAYADAFAADPKLTDDLSAGRRYAAACSAALAAAGAGENMAKLNVKERVRLRWQARLWLQADLGLLGKQAESANPQAWLEVLRILGHWQKDRELAGVRDAAALDKLPEAERAEWKKLWAEVGGLLEKTNWSITSTQPGNHGVRSNPSTALTTSG
jgi:hypothetical protein